jgi:tetratricopeptide (TPR) repeat protein
MADVQPQKIAALEKIVGTGAKSPLFAQLAGLYVQQGKATEALRLCDEGLATFPHYTTGHLIKGKALLALKMNAEARREFEIVADFLPANETVAFILSNIQPGEGETLVSPPEESAPPEPPVAEPPAEQTVTETAPPEQPMEVEAAEPTGEQQQQPANIFEAVGQTPEVVEDPFGFGNGGAMENLPPTESATAETTPNTFEGFPTQPEPETVSASSESSSESIFDFPSQAQEAPFVPSGEETFEEFAGRMRGELGGGESTIALEAYLNESLPDQDLQQEEQGTSSGETIEDLAEKLQSAKKITPVIDLSTKSTIPTSETDTPASTGFVTPTLAEIYAKQGWYDDAIKAYHTLIVTKPAEKERFEKRIAELEELKKQQG